MKLLNDREDRVLLAVTGLSCQVVTETVYALAEQDRDALPQAVYILTTREGAERARLLLLQEGWFERLRRDWELPDIAFGPGHIHVIRDANGQGLSDIRSPDDNLSAANTIAEFVQTLTDGNSSQLHVSIAGGRKTMGFFAGYALTLYGRKQDRLSHVLVSSEFESHPEFYYPTPHSRVIHTHPPESKPLDTKNAQVTLADIPFLRLRQRIADQIQNDQMSFVAVVAAAQKRVNPALIHGDLLRNPVFLLGDQPVALPPVHAAFYFWILQRQQAGLTTTAPPKGAPDHEYAEQYLKIHDRIIGTLGSD